MMITGLESLMIERSQNGTFVVVIHRLGWDVTAKNQRCLELFLLSFLASYLGYEIEAKVAVWTVVLLRDYSHPLLHYLYRRLSGGCRVRELHLGGFGLQMYCHYSVENLVRPKFVCLLL